MREALIRWTQNRVAHLNPGDLNFSGEFDFRYECDMPNGCEVRVKDPADGRYRFYRITVSETSPKS